MDAVVLELAQHGLAIDAGGQQHVVHVAVVLAVGWNDRAANQFRLLERGQHGVIAAPDAHPFARDALRLFELRPQECRDEFARQK